MKSEARIIKRYDNRKLYDPVESRYVTLEEVSSIIRTGQRVKVINSKTLEDITYQVLISLLFDKENKIIKSDEDVPVPVSVLFEAIRSKSGTLTGLISQMDDRGVLND